MVQRRKRETAPPERASGPRPDPEKTPAPVAKRPWGWIAVGVVVVATAGVVVARRSATPSGPTAGTAAAAAPVATPVGEPIDEARATQLFAVAKEALASGAQAPEPATGPPRAVVLTLARKNGKVVMLSATGSALEDAVRSAVWQALSSGIVAAEVTPIRIDALESLDPEEPVPPDATLALGAELGLVGLYLPEPDVFVLPDEILSHDLFDDGAGTVSLTLVGHYLSASQRERLTMFKRYHRARFGSFVARERDVVRLFRGKPPRDVPSPETLRAAAVAAGDYLVAHQKADGKFEYLFRAAQGTVDDSYNILRHAGTCYALYELAATSGRDDFRTAADRGLSWLLSNHGVAHDEADGSLSIVEANEVKLGAAALTLLAVLRSIPGKGVPDAERTSKRLGKYILSQQEKSGRFVSKTNAETGDPDAFESKYYPGEAILALARLHALDHDAKWLEAAEKGARYLIEVRDVGRAIGSLDHDHWLLIAIEALHAATGRDAYLDHGVKIGDSIVAAVQSGPPPDWEGSFYDPPRSTPAATRIEGLVALTRALERAGRPAKPYRDALARMVAFSMSCQITRESSLFLPAPATAIGGFRKNLTSYDVRIDFVQHAISGMLGYRELLTPRQ